MNQLTKNSSFQMYENFWITLYYIFKPSLDLALFLYLQTCKKFAAYERKIVFVIDSEQFQAHNSQKR